MFAGLGKGESGDELLCVSAIILGLLSWRRKLGALGSNTSFMALFGSKNISITKFSLKKKSIEPLFMCQASC